MLFLFHQHSHKLEEIFVAKKTFFACTFCLPNTDHVLILRRFGPFFALLKRVHADIFTLTCAVFNQQNKEPIFLSIITCFLLAKQNVQAKKGLWSVFTWRHGGHFGGVNNETVAMLEEWNILLAIELYFYANFSICFIMQIWLQVTWANTLY